MSDNKEDTSGQFWVLPLPKWDKSDIPLTLSALANKQTVRDCDFTGKRVLVRVDYNVPIEDGKVKNTKRIDATLETLKYILDPSRGRPKCVVLICHLGRPGGKFKKQDFSLEPVAPILREYLKDLAPVEFIPECVGPQVESTINECKECTVFLCENLRFHIEETGKGVSAQGKTIKATNDDVQRFRDSLTRLGDIFVFEAFGAAHRPHASVVGVNLPQRVAGLLLGRELEVFSQVLGSPKRPFLAILGGAKVSDKIGVIENLLNLVDEMVIGGGMAYTFKKVAENMQIGASLFDNEGSKTVQRILDKAAERKVKLHFPVDHVIGSKFAADADTKTVSDADGIPDQWMGLDIGPKTQEIYKEAMLRCKTIVWNGPVGVFEWEKFSAGTAALMSAMAEATKKGATTVIGGGDTGSAASKFTYNGKKVSTQVTHVSTGGGSTLVLMEGTMLPGIDALSNKEDLPPDNVNVKELYMQVHALQADNRALWHQVKIMQDQLKSVLKTPSPPPSP